MINKQYQQNSYEKYINEKVQLIFICFVIFQFLVAHGLVFLYQNYFSQNIQMSEELIIEPFRSMLYPELEERFVYIASILVFIVTVIFTTYNFKNIKIDKNNYIHPLISFLTTCIIIIYFLLLVNGTEFLKALLGKYEQSNTHIIRYFIALLIPVGLYSFLNIYKKKSFYILNTNRKIIWLIISPFIILQIISWRLFSLDEVTYADAWYRHFDPVIFTINQVTQGKTILVDMPSMYGLYPELIQPFFKIFELSVLNLTGLFAILQLISVISIFCVLSNSIKSNYIFLVSCLAFLMATYFTPLFISGLKEPYFQYWPIRFLWPAISIYYFFKFTKDKSYKNSIAISILSCVALVWNTDTGIMVVLSYLAYLGIKFFISSLLFIVKKEQYFNIKLLSFISLHLIIVSLGVLFFLNYLALKGNGSINIHWLIEYQNIFYNLGFFMMPMPIQLDPWIAILSIYAYAIIWAVSRLWSGFSNSRDDLLIYLSFLGIGLFLYYQGRSHVVNLLNVFWPSLIILSISADNFFRGIRYKLISNAQILIPIFIITLLTLISSAYVLSTPIFLKNIAQKFILTNNKESISVENEIRFIRDHIGSNKECLIISRRQGIYLNALSVSSPFVGPGLGEFVLSEDKDNLISEILNTNFKCMFIGVGDESNLLVTPLLLPAIVEKYKIVSTNSDNSFIFLIPK